MFDLPTLHSSVWAPLPAVFVLSASRRSVVGRMLSLAGWFSVACISGGRRGETGLLASPGGSLSFPLSESRVYLDNVPSSKGYPNGIVYQWRLVFHMTHNFDERACLLLVAMATAVSRGIYASLGLSEMQVFGESRACPVRTWL